MSKGAVRASRGSARLWNNLCLRDRPLGAAQAAALALRMEAKEDCVSHSNLRDRERKFKVGLYVQDVISPDSLK